MVRSSIIKSTVVLIMIAVIGCGWLWYSAWWERVEGLRWTSERQRNLEAAGERILTWAKNNNGRLPQNTQELVTTGLLGKSEISFRERVHTIRVTRTLRPVPSANLPGRLVLIIETYDPPQHHFNVLHLNGNAALCRNLASVIATDNAIRREHALPEIP